MIVEEWIGRRIRVLDAPNPAQIGLEGRAVDETMRTLVLRGADGRARRVPKAGARFAFMDEEGNPIVRGNDVLVRPQDRSKKLYRKIMG